MSLKIGDFAPDFTLKSHRLENVTLSGFKGKANVVILFFPLVNTPVCEKELCQMRDDMATYESLDAQVLAVSVDSSFAQKLWVEKNQFTFLVLSDFNKEVSASYGVLYDIFAPGNLNYKGVAKRSAFVIDKEGMVKYAEVLEDAGEEPDYEAIQGALALLN
ncbi:MAG: redoxin domain-containing protein [Ignavibacteria bacterium]